MKFMKPIRIVSGVILAMVFALSATADIIHHEEEEKDPLAKLSRKQREHFKVYEAQNDMLQKHQSIDRHKAFEELYTPVVQWSVAAAEVYKKEVEKLRLKVASLSNEKAKDELMKCVNAYTVMHQSCQTIQEAFKQHKKSDMLKAIQAYLNNEQEASKNRWQFVTRDWLSQDEASRYLRYNLSARKKRELVKAQQEAQKQRQQQAPAGGGVRRPQPQPQPAQGGNQPRQQKRKK